MHGTERIQLVDCLRGYALMGLFLIHMVEYFELYWLHPEPGPVNTAMFALFGGKAYAIFALLFGLSFFIILDRQAQKGVDFRWRFAWRVLLLLLLGSLHGLLYGGDILQVLAVAGFVILPFWRLRNGVLLGVSMLFLLQVPGMLYVNAAAAMLGDGYAKPLFLDLSQAAYRVYANGSLADVLAVNAWTGLRFKWAFMLESGRLSNVIGLALLGCLLGRADFFRNALRYRGKAMAALVICLLVAGGLGFVGEGAVTFLSRATPPWFAGNVVNGWRNTLLAAVSVLAFVLLYGLPGFARLLGLLAPPGRMSLTVYVAQSVLCVPLFYGFGLGAHAWIGQWRSLLLGVVLWVLMVAVAHAWLRRFHYGPLEWLWRSLTLTDPSVPLVKRNVA
jgi:uncharacterized protein